jgi:hypothetical protein|tara:strand:+ start:149 stop:685 length:537 start_codon:yes stop_codon:yes gene_type:complete
MGLQITGSFKDINNATYDNLYCRIDHYQLIKSLGFVATTVGYYISKEAAEPAFPTYQEDYAESDNSGFVDGLINVVDDTELTRYIEFPLTQSEQVTVTTYSSSFEDRLVDYIDYDDDGNEIIAQRNQKIEVITTGSEEVTKGRINMNLITGSAYAHAYEELKSHLSEIHGSNNINNLI